MDTRDEDGFQSFAKHLGRRPIWLIVLSPLLIFAAYLLMQLVRG
jgi:hypothetical protein